MSDTPSDPGVEAAALRDLADDMGFRSQIDPAQHGLAFASADELLAGSADTTDLDARRRSRRRRVLAVVSPVAAAGVFVLGVMQPWHPDRAAASTAAVLSYEYASASTIATATGEDASRTLRNLAVAARRMPEPARAGDVQHTVSDNWFASFGEDGDTETEVVPTLLERWLSPDGSLRTVEKTDQPLDRSGRGLSRADGWDSLPVSSDTTQEAGEVDAQALDRLPADPRKVGPALLELTGCTSRDADAQPMCLYSQLVDLHHTLVVPPRVDAAFWDLLGRSDAFRLLGDVKDRAGRSGVGISLLPFDAPEYRVVLIVSPKTGQLLGSEEILIKDDPAVSLEAPAITSFTAFLDSEWVSSSSSRS